MKKKVLFLDDSCPEPYDHTTLATKPLGGTEATVIRIAEGLSPKYDVFVAQHNRIDIVKSPTGVQYGLRTTSKPDFVVQLRNSGLVSEDRRIYPNAKLILWAHDLPTANVSRDAQDLADAQAHVVCVSKYHLNVYREALAQGGPKGVIRSQVIYNPIENHLHKDATPVKANKLVFFSSPHKGIERTLEVFDNFKNFPELKDCKLYVANPGYYNPKINYPDRVVDLGKLPHPEVIKHVREALCVFHLNSVFPETFGLVYAEANAVGTPFITHDLGAVGEVSDHPSQLLDVKNPKAVIDRVIWWKSGARPKVMGKEEFRLTTVLNQWYNLLT